MSFVTNTKLHFWSNIHMPSVVGVLPGAVIKCGPIINGIMFLTVLAKVRRVLWNLVVSVCIVFSCYLNERKRDPWGKKLILQLQLVRDVPLQSLFFKHLPLLHHVKQRARGHRNGHCAAGFGLQIKSRPMFTTAVLSLWTTNNLLYSVRYVQRCCHWRNDAPSTLQQNSLSV